MLTEFQQRKLSNLFAIHDLDHDGALRRDDYVEYTRRLAAERGLPPGSAKHDELLSKFLGFWNALNQGADANGDNRVTLPEWLTFFDRMLTARNATVDLRPIGDSVFGMLDKNGDGVITIEEYRWLFSSGGVSPALADDSFRRIDVDRDGRVTPSELSSHLSEFFLSNDPAAPGNWLFGPV